MTEDTRAQIVDFLEQQKYEEVLPILGELKDEDPTDRELQMYHLLVVRILILRWNLSRGTTESRNSSRVTSIEIASRLGSIVRVLESARLLRLFGRIYRQFEPRLTNRVIKQVVTAAAGGGFLISLLWLDIYEGRNVAIRLPSKIMTSAFALRPTVSVVDAKTYHPLNRSTTVVESGRLAPWPTKVSEENLFWVHHGSTGLLPTKHLKYVTGPKAIRSGNGLAKTSLHLSALNRLVGGQRGATIVNIENSRELPANESSSNKTPKKNVGYYQSGRIVSIRESPRFAAPTVQDIDRGTSLNVLEFVGSWAKVELQPAGITGFVHREFLIPVKENESSVAPSSSSVEEASGVTDLAPGPASQ